LLLLFISLFSRFGSLLLPLLLAGLGGKLGEESITASEHQPDERAKCDERRQRKQSDRPGIHARHSAHQGGVKPPADPSYRAAVKLGEAGFCLPKMECLTNNHANLPAFGHALCF